MASTWTNRAGDTLDCLEWRTDSEPRALVVGMHGLSCQGEDFMPLGEAAAADGIGFATWNLRGQGLDPVELRRGAFLELEGMLEDLEDFLNDQASRFGEVPVVLCGDSMGALLALQAAVDPRFACRIAGLMLFVPVVELAQKNPDWVKPLLRQLSRIFPKSRLQASWFVHGKGTTPKLTRNAERQAYLEQAPHRLGPLTLGFLAAMGDLIDASGDAASRLGVPVAVFSAGHDVFVTPEQTRAFFERIGVRDKAHFHYPDSYHELLFDDGAQQVIADAIGWLERVVPQQPASASRT